MTIHEVIGELTFVNYRFNRERSPDVTPAQWARIYPDAVALEARYQEEAHHEACTV